MYVYDMQFCSSGAPQAAVMVLMDLSLLGATILLFLCNPVVLVHSYDFWMCFGVV